MKDSYYFSHDYHARHDPKLSALIKIHGMEGYGTWWNLVEILHEQGGKIEKFPKFIEGLASELKQNEATLQLLLSCFINDLHLLKESKTHIWSERVLLNFKKMKVKSTQRAEAGRVGGIISGKKRSKTKQNEATLEANEANEAKEKKIKENKRKEQAEKHFDFPFIKNIAFVNAFNDFLEMRKRARKPATDRAKELVLGKLHKFPIEIAIKMLEKSTTSSWTDVYPLKEDEKQEISGFRKP
jgi:hypothetical protein